MLLGREHLCICVFSCYDIIYIILYFIVLHIHVLDNNQDEFVAACGQWNISIFYFTILYIFIGLCIRCMCTRVVPDFGSGKSGIRPFSEIQPSLASAKFQAGLVRSSS